MSAVLITQVKDVIDDMSFICEASSVMSGLSTYLQLYKILYPDLVEYHFTVTEMNDLLKKITGCLAALDTDLNCYPVGLTTAVLFDADGNAAG